MFHQKLMDFSMICDSTVRIEFIENLKNVLNLIVEFFKLNYLVFSSELNKKVELSYEF